MECSGKVYKGGVKFQAQPENDICDTETGVNSALEQILNNESEGENETDSNGNTERKRLSGKMDKLLEKMESEDEGEIETDSDDNSLKEKD